MTTPTTPADPCAAEREQWRELVKSLREALDEMIFHVMRDTRTNLSEDDYLLQQGAIFDARAALNSPEPQEDQ